MSVKKKSDKMIFISPIGDITRWLCEEISKEISVFFGFETRIASLIEDINFAFDENRNQYSSSKILDKLDEYAPDECLKIVAVTPVDLFIPILTYVFGEARINGRPCIISTHRLVSGFENEIINKGYRRIVKEAIHELGHTFNLRHCKDPACLMHYCRNLEDVDLKSDQFCRYCNILLADSIRDLSL